MNTTPNFQITREHGDIRPNRFAGKCAKCGGRVEAEAGRLGERVEGKWTILHLTCPEQTTLLPEVALGHADLQNTEPGIYINPDGSIWQVKENREKTNVYAKVWVGINGERLTLGGDREHGDWEYVRGGLRNVVEARKMTLDEAKQFIVVYGRCVRCSRRLKAAQSVEQGIGPVCIKYFEG